MITFTDIDGVLLTKPYIGVQFAKFMVRKGLLDKKNWEAMKNSYHAYQNGGPYKEIVESWNRGYRNALSGQRVEKVNQLIKEFEEIVELNELPYTSNLINLLKKYGKVIGVTAAIPELVHITNNYLELDDILGLKLLTKENGKYKPNKKLDDYNFKKHLVNEHKKGESILVLGDSIHDISMLKEADISLAVNPDHELKQVAKEKDWPIITKEEHVVAEVKKLVNKYE